MASLLVSSTPDRAVQVRALAGDIVLCSWARHFTLTAPPSTQSLNATEAGISSGLMGHLGLYADFTFYLPHENEAVGGIHFYKKWFRTKTRFSAEAKGNSEKDPLKMKIR